MINPFLFGPKLLLSVDPGGTTGWLLFRPILDESQPSGRGIEPVAWGEERSQIAFCDMVWRMSTARLAAERIDGIVIENWYPRAGNQTWEPEAVEIIGFCRWAMGGDPVRFFKQEVAHAESFGTPAKINTYRRERIPPNNVGKGGEGHAVMALKHAILFTNTRWSPEPRA